MFALEHVALASEPLDASDHAIALRLTWYAIAPHVLGRALWREMALFVHDRFAATLRLWESLHGPFGGRRCGVARLGTLGEGNGARVVAR